MGFTAAAWCWRNKRQRVYHALVLGWTNKADGGHGNGRKLPLAFAAVLLDNQAMKDSVMLWATQGESRGGIFGEDGDVST